jgi:hypothetical protein
VVFNASGIEAEISVNNPIPMQRRAFLKSTGLLSGVLAAASPWALIAPTRVWAVELRALSSTEGAALMAMTRTIAPHDKLEDAAYALVVQSIDADAVRDPESLSVLKEGLRHLGSGFTAASEPERVRALQAVESSAFFQSVRAKTLGTLYATPLAYAYFGYQGEAFSKGGYLFRGFNDLHWLPEVPPADSGPVLEQTSA